MVVSVHRSAMELTCKWNWVKMIWKTFLLLQTINKQSHLSHNRITVVRQSLHRISSWRRRQVARVSNYWTIQIQTIWLYFSLYPIWTVTYGGSFWYQCWFSCWYWCLWYSSLSTRGLQCWKQSFNLFGPEIGSGPHCKMRPYSIITIDYESVQIWQAMHSIQDARKDRLNEKDSSDVYRWSHLGQNGRHFDPTIDRWRLQVLNLLTLLLKTLNAVWLGKTLESPSLSASTLVGLVIPIATTSVGSIHSKSQRKSAKKVFSPKTIWNSCFTLLSDAVADVITKT